MGDSFDNIGVDQSEQLALKDWLKLRSIACQPEPPFIASDSRFPASGVCFSITKHQKWQLDEFLKVFGVNDE